MAEKPIKLNLGCGDKPLTGYVNLDARWGNRVFPLCESYVLDGGQGESFEMFEMPPAGVDEIRASHMLEHFPHGQTSAVLKDWVAHLKPGGVLKIAVPDFQRIARGYLWNGPARAQAEGFIMGGQIDENDFHRALFDEPGLRGLLALAGLTDIRWWESEINDCARLPISLNLQGTKPEQPEKVAADATAVQNARAQKMAAVMSVPRLCITSNVACLFRSIADLGIPCQPGQGVFWHHALTRQIEDRIAEGYDYLLAVDFDTWFLPGHVTALLELLQGTPEADAICAVQCRREDSLPILGLHDEAGRPLRHLPRQMFESALTRIHIAHFGLTLFRAAAFARLPKPWLRDEPDPNGSWRAGRRDADVAFWRNWEAAGLSVYMANAVHVGHLQEICTFSGPASENWRPVHVYLKDLHAGRIPPHCAPPAATKGKETVCAH